MKRDLQHLEQRYITLSIDKITNHQTVHKDVYISINFFEFIETASFEMQHVDFEHVDFELHLSRL